MHADASTVVWQSRGPMATLFLPMRGAILRWIELRKLENHLCFAQGVFRIPPNVGGVRDLVESRRALDRGSTQWLMKELDPCPRCSLP